VALGLYRTKRGADGEMKDVFLPLFRVKFTRKSLMLIKILTTNDSVIRN